MTRFLMTVVALMSGGVAAYFSDGALWSLAAALYILPVIVGGMMIKFTHAHVLMMELIVLFVLLYMVGFSATVEGRLVWEVGAAGFLTKKGLLALPPLLLVAGAFLSSILKMV